MRITSNGSTPTDATGRVVGPDAAESVATPSSATAAAAPTLQSAVLQPALAALREMPDIDMDKVSALRDALAKGEVPFDAAKLAGLIERFHGGKA